MKLLKHVGSVISVTAVLALGACENMNMPGSGANSGSAYPQATSSNPVRSGYGVVQSIEMVKQGSGGIGGTGIGVGTIAGAVVGGVVGNQIGQGQGNTAATVLGAAGGAYAGHEIEKRRQQTSDAYRFTIRMNDGSYQTLTQTTNPNIRVGDRVLIENGVARRY